MCTKIQMKLTIITEKNIQIWMSDYFLKTTIWNIWFLKTIIALMDKYITFWLDYQYISIF